MKAGIKSRNIVLSLLWKYGESSLTQGFQLLVQVILARRLLPEDYGIISLAAVFIALANVLINSGFTAALIQKKKIEPMDYSSVFLLSSFSSLIIYFLFFTSAPLIAAFYDLPELVPVFRIFSLTLFFIPLVSIQNAIIAKNLLFKKLFLSSFISAVVSGTIGILLAYGGKGVWALVWQQISQQATTAIILLLIVKWQPKLQFSWSRVKALFSFGGKLLLSGMLDALYKNSRRLIIGKLYNTASLGFYYKGQDFPALIVKNVDGSLQSVLFPVLAGQQDDISRTKSILRRTISLSTFIVFPMMVGLAVISEPLVITLLTEKWRPAIPYVQIFCLTYAILPIQTANLQAIKGLGHGGIFLKIEMLKKVIGLIILITTVFWGIYAIALGSLVSSLVSLVINTFPNKRLLSYTYSEQWHDIRKPLFHSVAMGLVVYMLSKLGLTMVLTTVIQIIAGITVYVALSWLFNRNTVLYLLTALAGLGKKTAQKN